MCWKCGKKLNIAPPISRLEQCPQCGSDVRSCRNCKYYLPDSRYDCHETVDEPVYDKERANFCQWFVLNSENIGSGNGKNEEVLKAKKAFDNLFKD